MLFLMTAQREMARAREVIFASQWRSRRLCSRFIFLEEFAEAFFERLAEATGSRVLIRKGGFHELVAVCDPTELNGEVTQKLDALQHLLVR